MMRCFPCLFQPRLLPRAASYRNAKQMSTLPHDLLSVWKNAEAVCFDVDSTVCPEEGIDVLASYCGAGEAVTALTTSAMEGSMLFEDALAARLDLITPSQADFSNCLEKHPPKLTPGIKELFDALHKRGTPIYLVSGGFRLMIEPVAEMLSVPKSHIFANTVFFNDDGTYLRFDPNEPTSRDGGKPAVMQMLKKQHGYTPLVMVGDGATDIQAKPPADLTIGFGGIVEREAVRKNADIYVWNFKELTDALA